MELEIGNYVLDQNVYFPTYMTVGKVLGKYKNGEIAIYKIQFKDKVVQERFDVVLTKINLFSRILFKFLPKNLFLKKE